MSEPATLVGIRQPFVGGAMVDGKGDDISVRSPATTDEVAVVAGASLSQFQDAIDAARRSFDDGPWSRMRPKERVAAMRRFGEALEARRAVLVDTVVAEAGCPRTVTEFAQVAMALTSIQELCDLYGAMPEWEHNEVPLGDYLNGSKVRVSIRRFEPSGVVAAITPYNFPFITNVWKCVPALLAGCSVVLRPSPLTPLEATVFAEVAQEVDLPPGVLNVVPEAESEGAVLLTTAPGVDVVTFTGSTQIGRAVAAQGAASLKRCILELGGKSVALHLPDTLQDGVASVVSTAVSVFLAHSGQGCSVQSRVVVPEDRREETAKAIADVARTLPIGDPASPSTLIGPLISEAQRSRVDALVKESVAEGARLVTGGRIPDQCGQGWFYEPTVLDAPDPLNPANQREFFGPVVSVLGYRDLDDAIGIANASPFGLSGGIYTDDLTLGLELAGKIRSGTVQVNGGLSTGYTPMGGYKQSGYGRERGAAGIRAFQELKHVVVENR